MKKYVRIARAERNVKIMTNAKDEIKQLLIRKFPYKTELHAHSSPASTCGQVSIPDLVRVYAEKGYSAAALTNHLSSSYVSRHGGKEKYLDFIENEINTAVEEGKKYNLNILWGAELRFINESDSDFLLYGVDREILSNVIDSLDYDIETFAKKYKDPRSFLIQAHPFRDDQIRADPSLLDAVEVFNIHPNHNSRIILAEKHARENNKIITCGTDFHEYMHAGFSATRFKSIPRDSFDLVRLLRENDFIFQIGGCIVIP